MSVSPKQFVAEMEQHWTSKLGNAPSLTLKAIWHQMADTFGDAINDHGKEIQGRKWRVLQPPTGTGKTQGLAVYCAALARHGREGFGCNNSLIEGSEGNAAPFPPIGVLVVTRLIDQADELVNAINHRAGHPVALARHSKTSPTKEEVASAQVLVITHASYRLGLDAVSRGSDAHWDSLITWDHGQRKLTVIDEALDVVDHAMVDLNSLSFALGCIPAAVKEEFPDQVRVLQVMLRVLEDLRERREGSEALQSGEMAWRSLFDAPGQEDMTPLRQALRGVPIERTVLGKDSPADRQRIAARVGQVLEAVEMTLGSWSYYYRKGALDTLNSAALLVPENLPGPVVLDATASQNLLWELFEDRVIVAPIPAGARNYRNVTLKVAYGGAVGKNAMADKAEARCGRLTASLASHVRPGSRVFVTCHKDVEPYLVGYEAPFGTMSVAHWGAIDGRNDWADHDTAVIFGLPYRDAIWAYNTFLAFKGPQEPEWFRSEEARRYREYDDIRRELVVRQLAVSVVQAINRVRCRRVIDGDGNCLPTTVYVVLPSEGIGRQLLAAVEAEMPGIVVKPWDFEMDATTKRRGRRSRHFERLHSYMANRLPGETSASAVRTDLGIPLRSWRQLTAKLKDAASAECQRLAEIGVSYIVAGAGRGRRAQLVKAA